MRVREYEKRFLSNIIKYKDLYFFIVVNFIGIIIRCAGRSFISGDMERCLIPWYDQIKETGGFSALAQQTGDYNILYQTIVAAMTYIDINCVFLYKGLSVLFDFILAFSIAWFLTKITSKKIFGTQFNLMYCVILLLPTVVLNSAYWGQCDSIYSTFLVLTLFFIFDEKYIGAFIVLGLGFAFKLQMIFVVPFIISYYFCTQKFSVANAGISAIVFWMTGAVGFIYGRNLLDPFRIYASQTRTYEHMYMNFPSFWVLTGDNYGSLRMFAILMTITLLGCGLYFMLSQKIRMCTLEDQISIATGFIWTCLLFLPAMHERYAYPLDILLFMLSFLNKKYLVYALVAVILSMMTYAHYLFGTEEVTQYHVLLYILMYVKYIAMLVNDHAKDRSAK